MDIKKGQIVDGKVTGIKSYGAFIEIDNGPVGLAFIEDLSVVRIKSPEERLKNGKKLANIHTNLALKKAMAHLQVLMQGTRTPLLLQCFFVSLQLYLKTEVLLFTKVLWSFMKNTATTKKALSQLLLKA